MATPNNPDPAPAPAGLTPASIAEAGDGLIRLWVAAFTLPITAMNAAGATLMGAVRSATSALDGNPPAPSDNELVRAASDLARAGGNLYTSLLSAAIGSLESLNDSLTRVVTDAQKTSPK